MTIEFFSVGYRNHYPNRKWFDSAFFLTEVGATLHMAITDRSHYIQVNLFLSCEKKHYSINMFIEVFRKTHFEPKTWIDFRVHATQTKFNWKSRNIYSPKEKALWCSRPKLLVNEHIMEVQANLNSFAVEFKVLCLRKSWRSCNILTNSFLLFDASRFLSFLFVFESSVFLNRKCFFCCGRCNVASGKEKQKS